MMKNINGLCYLAAFLFFKPNLDRICFCGISFRQSSLPIFPLEILQMAGAARQLPFSDFRFFMFAMMWFCFLFTHVDPKRQNISPKLIRALVWFMAALSPIVVCSSYAIALGIKCEYYSAHLSDHWTHAFGNLAIIWQKQNRTIVLAFGFHGHCPVKKTGIAHTVSAPDCLSFVAWL